MAGDPLAALNEAATAISDLGGLAKVKELIANVKEGQAAVERFGGLEKAEALVESLEALRNL